MNRNSKIVMILSLVLLLSIISVSSAADVDSFKSNDSISDDIIVKYNSNSQMEMYDNLISENNDFKYGKFVDFYDNSSKDYNSCDKYLNGIEEKEDCLDDEYDVMDNEEEIKNTTGIVMSNDSYSCGPASLATVLNTFGLNFTLNDVSKFADTTEENGTSMLSLIEASDIMDLKHLLLK